MLAIVKDALKKDELRELITNEITEKVKTQSATCYDQHDGELEGDITHYEIDNVKFSDFETDDMTVFVTVKGDGTATTGYKNSDGEYGSNDIHGPLEAVVTLVFDSDTQTSEDIEDIVDHIEISEVLINEVNLHARR